MSRAFIPSRLLTAMRSVNTNPPSRRRHPDFENWYPGRDSNPHGLLSQGILSPPRLPFRHPGAADATLSYRCKGLQYRPRVARTKNARDGILRGLWASEKRLEEYI